MSAPTDAVQRKIQIAGNSTFVISLPKEWALAQNIERGASVHLYPHDDRLVLAPTPLETAERSTRIELGSMSTPAAVHRVRAAYAAGCDRITVADPTGLDTELRREVSSLFAELIGMDVREERSTELVAVDLLDATEVSLPQTVTQIRQRALGMHDDAIEALLAADSTLATRVIERDDDVDRLFAFVSRGFQRGLADVTELNRLETDRTAAFRHYHAARQLERVADHAERIATVAAHTAAPDDAVRAAIEPAAATARDVLDLALDGSPDRAHERYADTHEAIESLERTLSEREGANAVRYGSVAESLRRTATLGLNLMESMVEASADCDC